MKTLKISIVVRGNYFGSCVSWFSPNLLIKGEFAEGCYSFEDISSKPHATCIAFYQLFMMLFLSSEGIIRYLHNPFLLPMHKSWTYVGIKKILHKTSAQFYSSLLSFNSAVQLHGPYLADSFFEVHI